MAKIIQTADLVKGAPLSADVNHWIYNGLDCAVTLEIFNKIHPLLDNTTSNTYAFSRNLQGPILEMTMRGVLIDISKMKALLATYRERIKFISEQLDVIVSEGIGVKLNWRSPAQLKKLFYDVMELPPVRKRNAAGVFAPTVNREALEKLETYMMAEPLCSRLLILRDLDKKRSFLETSIDADSRMRCNFNIAGTNTGRLASSASDMGTGTNMQNIDRELREIFIADPGMKFANLDLEQADARNVGAICWNLFHNSKSAAFAGAYLDACESGDLHTNVCRMAWTDLSWTDDAKHNKAIAEQIAYRNDSYRQLAKKLGHGTNYYGTPLTMARHTKVNKGVIEDFQRRYFSAFACIPEWHKWVGQELARINQLTTLFGRRRSFFGRPSELSTLREAIAYCPQSMTADEIDTGLLRLFNSNYGRNNYVQLLLQVHDSILIQFPEELENEIVPWAIEQLRVELELMGGRKFIVPVDAKVGWNWGDVQQDKEGNVINNPDGLIKWRGQDKRKRTAFIKPSLKNLLL
jgi:DNA polymerase-1